MSQAQIDFPLQSNYDSDLLANSAQPIKLSYQNLSQNQDTKSYKMIDEDNDMQEERKDIINDLNQQYQKPIKKRSNSFSLQRKKIIQFRNQRKHKIRDTQRQQEKIINNQKLISERFEKTGKEITQNDLYFLEDILQQHFLFSKIDDQEELQKLAKEFYHVALKGDTVFEEGDIPSLFYIIEEGSLDKIFMGSVREILKREETFGDFDMLRESPRTATIKAQPDQKCFFWCIDKKTYLKYAEDIVKEEVQENKEIIKNHHFFEIMTEEQQDEILHVTFTKQFKIGQSIGIQNQTATSYYIIKEGQVIVRDGNKEVTKLGPGDSIAYEEFIFSQVYKHEYIAYNSRVMCLKIDKSNIERYIGEELINFYYRNVQRYSCENNETLKHLDQTDIERIIAKSRFQTYKKDDVIIQKGTIPKQIFFILKGSAQLMSEENPEEYQSGSVILENKIEAPADFVMQNEGMLALFDFKTFLEYFGDQENLGEIVLTNDNPYICYFKKSKISSSSDEENIKLPEIKYIGKKQALKKQSTFEIRYNKSCDNLKGLLDSSQKQLNQSEQNNLISSTFNIKEKGSSFNLKEKENFYTESIRNICMTQSHMNHSNGLQNGSVILQQPQNLSSHNNSIIHEPLEQINQKVIEKFDIKDFTYIKQLGKGYFGVTHLCQQKETQKLYAIKIVQKSDIVEKHMDKQIIEEKIILETLEHPFIMKYYGSFLDEYNVFFVLQYITGIELFDVIRQKGLFSPEDLLYYAASLVNILEYLHEEQIVYRDLKPENIMINLEGEIKLIDLGASTRLTEKGGRTFTMTGTPHYMAPEITDGKGYSYYVDLWSLGIVLYECLCGPTPFGTNELEDPYEIYQAVKNNKLEFPDFVENEDIKDLITKLLNKKPFKRVGGSWATLKQHPYFDIKGKFDWTQLQEFYGYKPPYQPDDDFQEDDINEILKEQIKLEDKVQKIPYDNKQCKYDQNWEDKFKFDPDLIENTEEKQLNLEEQ